MPLGMKNNIASINAINHLAKAQKEMSDSLTRLASGQRINSGADSPEGLIFSETLRAQIAGMQQALQNSEFSLSLVQTAEGALVEVNNLLIEMRQLALTAANEGATDFGALITLQFQIHNAIEGVDRVSEFTRFGNKNLLDGSQGATGMGGNEELVFLNASAKTVASPLSGYEVDIDEMPERASLIEDLDDEDASGLQITLEEEDGAIIRVRNPEGASAVGFANRLKKAVFSANMNLDIRYDADDEELTIEHREYGFIKGFTITGSKDGVLVDDAYEPELFLGRDIEGTIDDEPAEGDGLILTGVYNNNKTSGLSVAFLGDSTGNAGSVTVAQHALKFQSGTNAEDQIVVALNSTHSTVLGRGVDNSSGFENLSQIRLTSTQEAIDAIRLVDEALDQLSSMRGQLGSVQKHTLETNISVLRSSAENLTAAESSIRDTDMALEMANFTKNQIITEAAAAAVAQANQTTSRVIRLLFNNNGQNHWSFFAHN
mgnify:FL=1|jgi:flagellin